MDARTPGHYARWAMEHAVAYGGMERAIAAAVEMAVAEAVDLAFARYRPRAGASPEGDAA